MINENDELCALKSRLYYIECSNCDARKRHVCYVNRYDLDEHLRSFAELFEFDNGRLEEILEVKL